MLKALVRDAKAKLSGPPDTATTKLLLLRPKRFF